MRRMLKPGLSASMLLLLMGCQPMALIGTSAQPAKTAKANSQAGKPAGFSASNQGTLTAEPSQIIQPDALANRQPQGVTAPPNGLTAPPQGITAPPQGITAPPQGITAPPLGAHEPLNETQFEYYDKNDDMYWDQGELKAYTTDWKAQNQQPDVDSFRTQAVSLSLLDDVAGLLDAFDEDNNNLLDLPEARKLHLSLGDLLGDTVDTVTDTVDDVGETVGDVLDNTLGGSLGSNTSAAVNQTTETVDDLVGGVGETVDDTVGNTTETASNLVENVSGVLSGETSVGETVEETVSDTTETVSEVVDNTTETVSETVSNTTETVGSVLNTVSCLLGCKKR